MVGVVITQALFFFPQVFDLLIQRYLEVPEVADQSLEQLLGMYGSLYKFHGERK